MLQAEADQWGAAGRHEMEHKKHDLLYQWEKAALFLVLEALPRGVFRLFSWNPSGCLPFQFWAKFTAKNTELRNVHLVFPFCVVTCPMQRHVTSVLRKGLFKLGPLS